MLHLLIPALTVVHGCFQYPWQAPSTPLDARVSNLLSLLTPSEKIANMGNAAPGAPRVQFPAYNWGHECERGDAQSSLGTCFPQSIGLSQSFNASLVRAVGVAAGLEVRASYNSARAGSAGAHCWSPMVNINRHPTWGRSQEVRFFHPHRPFPKGSHP